MEGFIAIYRKMEKWEWYQDGNTMRLFFHLLLKASHEGGNWQGQTIERGQLITGRKRLARDLKLTEKKIRTSLNKLKSTNEVTIKSTNKNSIITITNYELYNPKDGKRDAKATSKKANNESNERPTEGQRLATLKNEKNEKKIKEYLSDSEEMKLATGLFAMMKENNPKHREPNWQQWAQDFNMMLRVDKHSYKEIAGTAYWTQRHHFWKNNIQSPAKLRRQFARLFGEMEADTDNSHGNGDNIHSGFLQEPSYQPM